VADSLQVKRIGFTNYYTAATQLALILLALYWTSLHNYLLFHALVELTGVVITGVIFLIVWNARRYIENGYFIFIGIALLFAGGISLLHILAYKGMGVFPEGGSDLPTQLWIAGRYMVAISFLLAPLFIKRKIDVPFTVLLYFVAFSLVLLSIFYWKNFPVAYIEGYGLTHFKKDSEYLISFLLVAAAITINSHTKVFSRRTRLLLILSLIASVMSEIAFTEYVSVYGPANLVGHLFLVTSFYLLYLGIIEIALRKPSHNFYRNLVMSRLIMKKSEEKIRRINERLEDVIRARTFDLKKTNEKLNVRNLLLKLSTVTNSRKQYLNELVKLIKEWTGCGFVGIRILNDTGSIPYNAHSGFSQQFWKSENWLSVRKDECICTRVFRGKSEPQDLKMMTDEGSFFCNDTLKFNSELSQKEKNRFRGVCTKQGFASLGVIPIWYGKGILGVIHIADKEKGKSLGERVEFLESLSPLIGTAIHKYNTVESLDKSKRALAVLSKGNHILVHAKNEKELLDNVTSMIIDEGGYSIAWIGYVDNGKSEVASTVAQAGIDRETLTKMIKNFTAPGRAKGSSKAVIDTGKTQVRQNIQIDPRYSYMKNSAIKHKFKSSISIPLKNNNVPFGVLTIYAKESVAFDKKEIKLLEELAGDMAYGINTLRMREAKERSEKQLLESYNHLGMLNRKISVLLDLDKTAKSKRNTGGYILEMAVNISQADVGLLYKFDNDGNFSLLTSRGVGKRINDDLRFFSSETFKFLNVLVKKQSIMEVRSDVYNLGCLNINNEIRCYLVIPLLRRKTGELKGVIFLGYANDKKLFSQELEFYDVFERHASSALFNAKIL